MATAMTTASVLMTERKRCDEIMKPPSPRGEGGFGYDPLMFIPTLGRSVAELQADEKNRLSHRALAASDMLALMRAHWLA